MLLPRPPMLSLAAASAALRLSATRRLIVPLPPPPPPPPPRLSPLTNVLPLRRLHSCLGFSRGSENGTRAWRWPEAWELVPLGVSLYYSVRWCSGLVRTASQVNNKYMSTTADPSFVVAPLVTDHAEVELLTAVSDDHGGVIVEMKEPMNSETFVSSLRTSISNWRKQGVKGVWMKLPIELANLVQPAVEEGFLYHHAEPSYLMLVFWIPATKSTLPVNATHRVGVGAFVMNDKREVLVVQENSGKFRGSGVWKFPTGVVDQGEDIFAGAIREVKEETGINTKFVEVLAFRQSHMSFFEKSDLFFLCLLHPISFDIQKQESEIEEAKWMPIEEYASQPFVQKHELLKYILDVGLARIEKRYSGFSAVSTKSAFSDRQSFLYLNNKDLNQ